MSDRPATGGRKGGGGRKEKGFSVKARFRAQAQSFRVASALGAAALSALAAILITGGPAPADLSNPNSPHNLTGAGEPNIAPGGLCTPCHWMHYARDSASRNGTGDGRGICAACHGLSDLGSPVTM